MTATRLSTEKMHKSDLDLHVSYRLTLWVDLKSSLVTEMKNNEQKYIYIPVALKD